MNTIAIDPTSGNTAKTLIPPDFQRRQSEEEETGEFVRQFPNALSNHSAPFWVIQTEEGVLRAIKPIGVNVRRDGDFYFAENETLSIFGTGLSANEAVTDFFRHIIHFYTYYKNLTDDQVTGEAIQLKRRFASLFVQGS